MSSPQEDEPISAVVGAEVDPSPTVPSSDSQVAVPPDDGIPAPPDPSNDGHANPPQSDSPTAPSHNMPPAVEGSAILSPIPKKLNLSSDHNVPSPRSHITPTDSSLTLPEGVILPPTVTQEMINKVSGSLRAAFFQVRLCLLFF
jgi:hypothetical protein